MTSPLKSAVPSPVTGSILLVLVAGIGDFVMATPAIRAVRNGHPDANIHLLTSSEGAALAQDHAGVDRVFAFPIRELRSKRLRLGSIARLLRELRRTHYDLAANLYPISSRSGWVKMGLLFSCLSAETKIRHTIEGAPPPDASGVHMVDRMRAAAIGVGGRPDAGGLELPVKEGSAERWQAVADWKSRSPSGHLIGISPGGDRPNRRWPVARFARVARELSIRFGARVLILGGPGDEPLGRTIQDALGGAAVNLAGRVHLQDLPFVIGRCDLLICNDSGPMHIAAARHVPVVAVFGPEDVARCRPYTSPDLCRVLLRENVPCRPCGKATCADAVCLKSVSPDEVVRACVELLGTRSAANTALVQGEA